jgi:plastocyanin
MKWVMGLIAALMLTAQAHAADVTITVKDNAGAPVPDAVVTLYPGAGAVAGPIKFDWPYRMAQHNIKFDPFVLVVPVGATVSFPNLDTVRHHIYSFSTTKKFEIKLYGHEETRTVMFDKPGVAALGCNIHDQMVAFIKVVDTPYAMKTDAACRALIKGAPAGALRMRVWHPYLKAKGGELETALAPGVTAQNVTISVRAPRAMHGGM